MRNALRHIASVLVLAGILVCVLFAFLPLVSMVSVVAVSVSVFVVFFILAGIIMIRALSYPHPAIGS